MGARLNLIDKKFGLLTVVSENGKDNQGFILWECKCSCGKFSTIRGAALKIGSTQSCGCLKANNNKSHDKSRTKEYECWIGMKDRCQNPNNAKFNLYGGRGIKVCDRWLNSFENFFADMDVKPSLKHSLDRFPNKDGNYEPSNCRWATIRQQNTNKKGNIVIEYKGETKTAIEWSESLGMGKSTFLGRLKMNWPIERIMTERINRKKYQIC